MLKKSLLVGGLTAVATLLSGCATLKNGPYEKIAITSAPDKALCRIYREGVNLKAVATPGEVYVPRGKAPVQIVCSKPGYSTTTVDVASEHRGTTEQGVLGNFATLGVGFVVDGMNSAMYHLPDEVHVELK